jgi:ankyrin repeat protein
LSAVRDNQGQLAIELLGKGVSVDIRDAQTGNSLLHLAAQNGNVKLIELLMSKGLKNGGNFNKEGKVPADLATLQEAKNALKALPLAPEAQVL